MRSSVVLLSVYISTECRDMKSTHRSQNLICKYLPINIHNSYIYIDRGYKVTLRKLAWTRHIYDKIIPQK